MGWCRSEEKDSSPRPLHLFPEPVPIEAVAPVPDDPPVMFRWRNILHRVIRADGPERIACEWWRERGRPRDYYRVEDSQGRRFWLYREGLFQGEANGHAGAPPPAWYLHGIFA